MKKLTYPNAAALCLACLLTATACTQDELPGGTGTFDGGIVFTSPYTLTRSDAMRYGSFREDDQVGVLGYCKATNQGRDNSGSPWEAKKDFCKPEVFYNEPLTYTGKGLWEYDWTGSGSINGLRPWYEPGQDDNGLDYTYSFFAYYPYAENGTIYDKENKSMGKIELSTKDATGDPQITYTMPHLGYSNTDKLDWTKVPDLMLAYTTDHGKADGTVKLDFRHLFCAFEFKVNNYTTEDVTISALTVSGSQFYRSVKVNGRETGYDVGDNRYSGTFNVLSTYTGNQGFTCPAGKEITDTEDQVIGITPATVSITTDGTVNAEGDPVALLFIPDANGKLTANDHNDLTLNITVDGIEQNRTMILTEATFKAGVRSVFNINIVGNDIYLQLESDGSWDDGGDSDITFE